MIYNKYFYKTYAEYDGYGYNKHTGHLHLLLL